MTDSSGKKGSRSPWPSTLGACDKGSAGEIPSLNPTTQDQGSWVWEHPRPSPGPFPRGKGGSPAHTLSWAPSQAPRSCCPSSQSLCQPCQPLPGLGRQGLESWGRDLMFSLLIPLHALTRLDPAGRQASSGSAGTQSGAAGHLPRPDSALGSCRLLGLRTADSSGPALSASQATWQPGLSPQISSFPEPAR